MTHPTCGLLMTVMLAVACGDGQAGVTRSSGSLAASRDGALLYAADTDNGILAVIDVKTRSKLAEVKVGQSPWRVAVGADDTLYVANRGSRSVSVIGRGTWSVARQIATDVDPVGMVTSADGKTLYVVCATSSVAAEYGTLTAFDTMSLEPRWSLELGDEPRGIALVEGNRAVVSLYRAGDGVEVNLDNGTLTRSGTDIYARANANEARLGRVGWGYHPRAASDVIANSEGTRVFLATSLAREAPIRPPTTAFPYYEGEGPGNLGSVSTAAVFTFDTSDGMTRALVDDVWTGEGSNDHPQTSYAATGPCRPPDNSSTDNSKRFQPFCHGSGNTLQGPTVGVVDSSGAWLFLVNRESSNLAIISANTRFANPSDPTNDPRYANRLRSVNELPSLHSVTAIGAGADGVAVIGPKVFVYSQFDHQVQQIDVEQRVATPIAAVGRELLSPTLVAGRKMFYDANDRRISSDQAAVACSACHLEGRDDSHTWSFPDGPRRTPSLAGRGTLETAPYHWSGEFETVSGFLNHTITQRMGGAGLDLASANAVSQYLGSLPAPENPYLARGAALNAQQARGQQVFLKAQCGTCHGGTWFTTNGNAQVGTLTKPVAQGAGSTSVADNGSVVEKGFNIPSLKGLARSGPYLHDGSVATLSERVLRNPGDQHGVTSTLRPEEIVDLVAYLRGL